MHQSVYRNETALKLNIMMKRIIGGMYVKRNWKNLLDKHAENGHRWRLVLADDAVAALEVLIDNTLRFKRNMTCGTNSKRGN